MNNSAKGNKSDSQSLTLLLRAVFPLLTFFLFFKPQTFKHILMICAVEEQGVESKLTL